MLIGLWYGVGGIVRCFDTEACRLCDYSLDAVCNGFIHIGNVVPAGKTYAIQSITFSVACRGADFIYDYKNGLLYFKGLVYKIEEHVLSMYPENDSLIVHTTQRDIEFRGGYGRTAGTVKLVPIYPTDYTSFMREVVVCT